MIVSTDEKDKQADENFNLNACKICFEVDVVGIHCQNRQEAATKCPDKFASSVLKMINEDQDYNSVWDNTPFAGKV